MPGLQVLTGLDGITNPKASTLLAPAGLSRHFCIFAFRPVGNKCVDIASGGCPAWDKKAGRCLHSKAIEDCVATRTALSSAILKKLPFTEELIKRLSLTMASRYS